MTDELILNRVILFEDVENFKIVCDGDGYIRVFDLIKKSDEPVRVVLLSDEILKFLQDIFVSNNSRDNVLQSKKILQKFELLTLSGTRKTKGRKTMTDDLKVKPRGIKLTDKEYEKLKELGGATWLRQELKKY